jgi:DNA-binding NarL/FixJ family response regulator
MRRATVLLADDHGIVADGLRSLLRDHFDLVGTVADGAALVEAARRLRPDVIVSDIAMPVLSGLEVLRILASEDRAGRFIVLTMHADAQLVTEAFRLGAAGYVLKHSAGEELISAIHEALHGRSYLTPLMTKEVMATLTPGGTRRQGMRLTMRQRDVLRLIAQGRRMKEIAGILQLSRRTVETHKYEMMHQLGLRTTAGLIRYAVEHEELLIGSSDPIGTP